ncbi:GNAT family N-acetyltransferase [Sandaracinus amylolyticus]|uniref:GNAT family N-acetyltransferase n=1 Tax=Sandaracinus amylolyticus TaxID=927083 RepID=UPI001F024170|nr:GNAT family N-acetyltransferase [Sandaracinus amylolyticus]UJR81546.1 GNAT family acetyltransferase YhhY [Sandaracinus amylolyticus]
MITLRAITIDDASDVHRLCAHAEVARFLGGLPTDGLDGWKKRILELPHDRASLIGAFEESALIGVAMLDGQLRARRKHIARMWVAVDPTRWGRGVAKQMMGALVDAADRWWAFVRLELDVHADHAPAIALYRSLGFEVEAQKRCDMLRDGRIVDGLHMARIRPGFTPPEELASAPVIAHRGTRLSPARIRVRPHRPDDAAEMAAMQGTDSVMEGTFATPFQSEREWRARLTGMDASVRGLVAIVDGKLAGSAALFAHASPRLAHACGFGISVHPDFQGCGVGDALTAATCELADRWIGAKRIQLEVYADNLRAQALYRKHGFELEGTQRYASFRRGTYCDAHLMSRIRS